MQFCPHLIKYLVVSMILYSSDILSWDCFFELAKVIYKLKSPENIEKYSKTYEQFGIAIDSTWMEDPIIDLYLDIFYHLNFGLSSRLTECFLIIIKDYVLCNWNIEFLDAIIVLLIRLNTKLFGSTNILPYKTFIDSLASVFISEEIVPDVVSAQEVLKQIHIRIVAKLKRYSDFDLSSNFVISLILFELFFLGQSFPQNGHYSNESSSGENYHE